jgi:tetratricopeptide (TPR) repeat protein
MATPKLRASLPDILNAQSHMKKGNYDLACQILADLIILYPLVLELRVLLGTASYFSKNTKRLENANKIFDTILIEHLDNSEKYIPGDILAHLRRFEEAKKKHFLALNSCKDSVDLPEIGFVHNGLTELSHKDEVEICRPEGFHFPYNDQMFMLELEEEDIHFRYRSFLKNSCETRLITIEDIWDIQSPHSSQEHYALLLMKAIAEYHNDNLPPFRKNLRWVLHIEFNWGNCHTLHEIRFENDNIILRSMSHREFENLSGYRLLWKPEHER